MCRVYRAPINRIGGAWDDAVAEAERTVGKLPTFNVVWLDLVRWHDAKRRERFEQCGGEEVDHVGDGFFVALPTPTPRSTAPSRSSAASQSTAGRPVAPQVRIGLHATEVSADGDACRGRGVHEAARISAVAGGSEIVASRATVDGRTDLPLSDPREVELKGIENRSSSSP